MKIISTSSLVCSIAIGVVVLLQLTGCSSSYVSAVPETIPDPKVTSSAVVAPTTTTDIETPYINSAEGDMILRRESRRMAAIRQEYDECKDLRDYARMIKLARARRIELDDAIRQVRQIKMSAEDHERILNPLRQERDWQLQVIEATSAMSAIDK